MRFSIVRLLMSVSCVSTALGLRQLLISPDSVIFGVLSELDLPAELYLAVYPLMFGVLGSLIGLAAGVLIGKPWTSAIVGALASAASAAMLIVEAETSSR